MPDDQDNQQTTDDQSASQSGPSDEKSSEAPPSDTSSSVDATSSSSDQASLDQNADQSVTPTLDTSQASIAGMPEDALAFNEYDTSWIDSGSEVA